MTRLDKYICDCGILTRSEAVRAVRSGRVTVNGNAVKDPSLKIDENSACVVLDSKTISWKRFRYIMLNKPNDTVSTTEDDPKSVMKLLPNEFSHMDMFPCGRLDIDTTGLLIITNDGQTAHNLLSPKKHCEKTYRFTCKPITEKQKCQLENGIELSDFTSKPCSVSLISGSCGEITVTEGKYHQIKRMFLAVGSEILTLERIMFAGIRLDDSLNPGEWRELTEEEENMLLGYNINEGN